MRGARGKGAETEERALTEKERNAAALAKIGRGSTPRGQRVFNLPPATASGSCKGTVGGPSLRARLRALRDEPVQSSYQNTGRVTASKLHQKRDLIEDQRRGFLRRYNKAPKKKKLVMGAAADDDDEEGDDDDESPAELSERLRTEKLELKERFVTEYLDCGGRFARHLKCKRTYITAHNAPPVEADHANGNGDSDDD